jgi:polysaccharide biosynthesis protein PelD
MFDWKFATKLKNVLGKDRFAPDRTATREQWIEITLIPIAAALLGWMVRPGDPTLSGEEFPWQWLAPVLVALRYGVWPGLFGSAILLINGWIAAHEGLVPANWSSAPLFGGGLLVLICGEFSDVWHDRTRRMEETYLYVTERLSRLTKRHLLLNLSHDRLEQEMLARPGSLRDALVGMRTLALQKSPEQSRLPGAQELLLLLSQYVNIEAASVYTVQEKNGVFALGTLVASLGDPADLSPDDELITLALESGNLAHIAVDDTGLKHRSDQLVVAPLIAGEQEVIGVLAVNRMPFLSLNSENLQMLLVLLGYYADNLGSAPGVASIHRQMPGMPFLFAQELARMMNLHSTIGMDSHLVVMRCRGRRSHEIVDSFLRIKRGLDLYWKTVVQDQPVLVVLLPFASISATDGFLERLDGWLDSHFKGDILSLGISLQVIGVDAQDLLGRLEAAMAPV